MYRLARANRYITLEGENMVDSKSDELEAQLHSSLCLFEKCGIVEKQYYGKQTEEYEFFLTKSAKKRLDSLLRRHRGNRSLACTQLLLEKTATGKKNAKTLEELDFNLIVLHLIVFDEGPSEKDAENPHSSNNKCDAICELCLDETCPAKDVEIEKQM
jgi:hypothetical protein